MPPGDRPGQRSQTRVATKQVVVHKIPISKVGTSQSNTIGGRRQMNDLLNPGRFVSSNVKINASDSISNVSDNSSYCANDITKYFPKANQSPTFPSQREVALPSSNRSNVPMSNDVSRSSGNHNKSNNLIRIASNTTNKLNVVKRLSSSKINNSETTDITARDMKHNNLGNANNSSNNRNKSSDVPKCSNGNSPSNSTRDNKRSPAFMSTKLNDVPKPPSNKTRISNSSNVISPLISQKSTSNGITSNKITVSRSTEFNSSSSKHNKLRSSDVTSAASNNNSNNNNKPRSSDVNRPSMTKHIRSESDDVIKSSLSTIHQPRDSNDATATTATDRFRSDFFRLSSRAMDDFETWEERGPYTCRICDGGWREYGQFKYHLETFHDISAYIYFIKHDFIGFFNKSDETHSDNEGQVEKGSLINESGIENNAVSHNINNHGIADKPKYNNGHTHKMSSDNFLKSKVILSKVADISCFNDATNVSDFTVDYDHTYDHEDIAEPEYGRDDQFPSSSNENDSRSDKSPSITGKSKDKCESPSGDCSDVRKNYASNTMSKDSDNSIITHTNNTDSFKTPKPKPINPKTANDITKTSKANSDITNDKHIGRSITNLTNSKVSVRTSSTASDVTWKARNTNKSNDDVTIRTISTASDVTGSKQDQMASRRGRPPKYLDNINKPEESVVVQSEKQEGSIAHTKGQGDGAKRTIEESKEKRLGAREEKESDTRNTKEVKTKEYPLVRASDENLRKYGRLTSGIYLDGYLDHVCQVCDRFVPEATEESLAAHLRKRHHINLMQYKAVFIDSEPTLASISDCCLYHCPMCSDDDSDSFYTTSKEAFWSHMMSVHCIGNASVYMDLCGDIEVINCFMACPQCSKVMLHSSEALFKHIKQLHNTELSKDEDIIEAIRDRIRSLRRGGKPDLNEALEDFLKRPGLGSLEKVKEEKKEEEDKSKQSSASSSKPEDTLKPPLRVASNSSSSSGTKRQGSANENTSSLAKRQR